MRSLARWGVLPLLFAPLGTTWALGLGEIEMQSALNEPFRAEIEIASATADELESLRIGLAPAATFDRFGISRPAFLSNFQFRVGVNNAGRNVVIVTQRPERSSIRSRVSGVMLTASRKRVTLTIRTNVASPAPGARASMIHGAPKKMRVLRSPPKAMWKNTVVEAMRRSPLASGSS